MLSEHQTCHLSKSFSARTFLFSAECFSWVVMTEAKRNRAVMLAELATWLSWMPTFSNFDAFVSAVFNSWVWWEIESGKRMRGGGWRQHVAIWRFIPSSYWFCLWPNFPRLFLLLVSFSVLFDLHFFPFSSMSPSTDFTYNHLNVSFFQLHCPTCCHEMVSEKHATVLNQAKFVQLTTWGF